MRRNSAAFPATDHLRPELQPDRRDQSSGGGSVDVRGSINFVNASGCRCRGRLLAEPSIRREFALPGGTKHDLTGVGMQVAGGELAGLFGLPKQGHGTLAQVGSVLERLGSTHRPTLAISAVVLALILGCARFAPRVPGALIAVIGAIIASATLDLSARGIATVGTVPGVCHRSDCQRPELATFTRYSPPRHPVFIVIIAQSAATARAYALRYRERVTENLDFIGLAGANALAAVTGTFVVNGSPTKTEMLDAAGGRSQIAQLTTAAVVLLVVLFLTRPLSFLPDAVLAGIVFMIGVKLIDVKGLRELWRVQRNEFWIAAAAALTVVVFSVMDAIAVAVLLSLIEQVRHTYRPRTRVLFRDANGHWTAAPPDAPQFAAQGVLVYRFEANLFYANASAFMEEILRLCSRGGVRALVLDASGINEVDYSAAKMLLQLREELIKRGLRVVIVTSAQEIRDRLQLYGLAGQLAQFVPTVDAAMKALTAADR